MTPLYLRSRTEIAIFVKVHVHLNYDLFSSQIVSNIVTFEKFEFDFYCHFLDELVLS